MSQVETNLSVSLLANMLGGFVGGMIALGIACLMTRPKKHRGP